MGDKAYVISEYEFKSLQALAEFSDNAFAGYSGEAGEQEKEVAVRFAWLAEEYIKLLKASADEVEGTYDTTDQRYHYVQLRGCTE
jgi:hypothetical protein